MQQFRRVFADQWSRSSLSPKVLLAEWSSIGGGSRFPCSNCSGGMMRSGVATKRLLTVRPWNLAGHSPLSNPLPACIRGKNACGNFPPSVIGGTTRGFGTYNHNPSASAIVGEQSPPLSGTPASPGVIANAAGFRSLEDATTCGGIPPASNPPPPRSDPGYGYISIDGRSAVCVSMLLGFAAGAGMATYISQRGSKEEELQQTLGAIASQIAQQDRQISQILEGRSPHVELLKPSAARTFTPIRLQEDPGTLTQGLSPPLAWKGGLRTDDDAHKQGEALQQVLHRHSIADAAAKAAPAVVNIKVTIGSRGMSFGQFSGTGSIIKADGTILTNAHVVAEVSGRSPYQGKLLVTMHDGRSFDGEVVSFDSLADIAVVKVKSSLPLPTVKLGTSRNLRPGDWVVALGSPLHLQNTVTAGIVSCVDRKSSEIGLRGGRMEYIQTDAAINQGNSGGPLINLDGEVIGINNMKAVAADGVSFAIPVDTAMKVVEQLSKHGRVIRPFIGMKMLELNDAIVNQLKERDSSFPDVEAGILVPQVIAGSPAARAGMMPGDVVVEFDGQQVTTVRQIMELLGDRVGEKIKVVVKRARGKTAVLHIVTEEITNDL
ncbi:hypothetical protein CBR_g39175 [Chara braunii]|uniref:PDZ domain-containing protein n=1 Tax=Chara braunii TaxID=69332 RepID=A0A388LRB0_CHABU|nr:hypothetical protein CBR_g39175 [Chara braunii]|eukprot:GBG84799.1 hypothetical protein CBR_g39175 [Chara braunii]